MGNPESTADIADMLIDGDGPTGCDDPRPASAPDRVVPESIVVDSQRAPGVSAGVNGSPMANDEDDGAASGDRNLSAGELAEPRIGTGGGTEPVLTASTAGFGARRDRCRDEPFDSAPALCTTPTWPYELAVSCWRKHAKDDWISANKDADDSARDAMVCAVGGGGVEQTGVKRVRSLRERSGSPHAQAAKDAQTDDVWA